MSYILLFYKLFKFNILMYMRLATILKELWINLNGVVRHTDVLHGKTN